MLKQFDEIPRRVLQQDPVFLNNFFKFKIAPIFGNLLITPKIKTDLLWENFTYCCWHS
jgi:hypothetical protein